MTLIDIAMPQLGQSVSEGTVVKWLKAPGDAVARDEGVVAISTDKAEAEVPAPAAGVLAEMLVPEGRVVECGTVLGRLRVEGAAVAGGDVPRVEGMGSSARDAASPLPLNRSGRVRDGSFLSPAVRQLAREKGLPDATVRGIEGSGRGARVTHADLVAWLAKSAAASSAPGAPEAAGIVPGQSDFDIVPMTGMRAKIAEHMLAAKRNIPHVNTVAEFDVSAISEARRAHGPAFQARHGFSLSYNAFLLKACATALMDFPAVNAVLEEAREGGSRIVQHHRVHLGMAVALEPSGLVVPVVRDAQAMSVRGLALESQRLADRARKRQLLPDEMQGGTCTMTNPGVFGNLFGTPIIHAPQAAIIDFGAIKKRPVVISGPQGDSIGIRPTCFVVLAWDHRVMDGASAARFLQRLVRTLEALGPESGID